jgi:putative membrane protein
MKYLLTAIGLLALLAAPAAAQTAQPGGGTAGSTMPAAKAKLSAQDRDFVKRAAIGGMAEVEEGKLATQHAQSDAVKNFGQQMVTDHTKINADLQAIASRIGVTPPATLDKEHAAMLQRLGKLSGPQFDRSYMQDQVSEHRKTISLFEKEDKSGQNAELKTFATNTLPTLRRHLQMAQDVSAQLRMSAPKS